MKLHVRMIVTAMGSVTTGSATALRASCHPTVKRRRKKSSILLPCSAPTIAQTKVTVRMVVVCASRDLPNPIVRAMWETKLLKRSHRHQHPSFTSLVMMMLC